MESGNMEHVSSLCALGTIGIGITGLALAREGQVAGPRPTSRKRKAPGLIVPFRSFSSPLVGSNGSLVHPPAVNRIEEREAFSARDSRSRGALSRPAFWRKTSRDSSQAQMSTPPISRQSSLGPSRSLHSAAGHEKLASGSVDDPDSIRTRSWLKRISTMSSLSGSPASSIRPMTPSVTLSHTSATPVLPRIASTSSLAPNKLVKRSASQRAMSSNNTSSIPLRRPATSHQRSTTMSHFAGLSEGLKVTPEYSRLPTTTENGHQAEAIIQVWRPYFTEGRSASRSTQSRKRHTSGPPRATAIRTISSHPGRCPTLLSVSSIEPQLGDDDLDDLEPRVLTQSPEMSTGGEILRPVKNRGRLTSGRKTIKRSARHSFSLSEMFSSSSPADSRPSRRVSHRERQNCQYAGPENNASENVSISPIPDRNRSTDDDINQASVIRATMRRSGELAGRSSSFSYYSPNGGIYPDSDPTGTVKSHPSPLSPISNVSTFDVDLPRGTPKFPPTPLSDGPAEFGGSHRRVSSSHMRSLSRTQRISLVISDLASTTPGSDNDTRVFTSGDEDSMDFQSDTVYDSLATRATANGHSGLRGPRVDTIFDESPSTEVAKDLGQLRGLENLSTLNGLAIAMDHGGNFADHNRQQNRETRRGNDDEEMEDVQAARVSTPSRTSAMEEEQDVKTPMPPKRLVSGSLNTKSSPWTIDREQAEGDNTHATRRSIGGMSIDDESDWDKATDQESTFDESMDLPELPKHSARRVIPGVFRAPEDENGGTVNGSSTSYRGDQRLSIFDWSEQQRLDKDSYSGTGGRPKTVHGKQAAEIRGSRSSGRKGSSAVHLRSQSVPVTRDTLLETDVSYPAPKFGTWGLGNKGVSEEWTDDFDFDEAHDLNRPNTGGSSSTEEPLPSMRVPQAIIDRQASVRGQYGQVQEFMRLVEELKRLRTQGVALDLLDGESRHWWEYADNIISLATINDEDDDDIEPPRSPISSNGFDSFDESSPPTTRARPQPYVKNDGTVQRRSPSHHIPPPLAPAANGRPRGESLAQARSFLETLHQNRKAHEASPAEMEIYQQDKTPFDTRDLRDLVACANAVTRALKDVVRVAQGVSLSPEEGPSEFSDPPFSRIFSPNYDSPSRVFRRAGLSKSHSANGQLDSGLSTSSEHDISGHLKLLAVV